MDVRTEVQLSGPLFDGRALDALAELTAAAVEAVSDRGVTLVQDELAGVLQNPTGFYEGQIQSDRASPDRGVVTDGGVIYGPWLAGAGSMNAVTDFDGYDHWRQAGQRLDQEAQQIADQTAGPHVDRMNQ